MLDITHIPNQSADSVKIYYAQSGTNAFQIWQKPRNCKFVYITTIGGAAGGFGGGVGTAVSASGGGSGTLTVGLFEANSLPDKLYILVGTGSLGGIGATTAVNNPSSQAGDTIVCAYATTGTANTILLAFGATGSAAGPATSNGGSVTTRIQANSILTSLGTFNSRAGQAGSNTADTSILATNITCAGGRGSTTTSSTGSNIASLDLTTIITPTIIGGAINGGRGANGIWNWKPIMYGTGGAGGGGATSGTAGNGGDGAYGCGGGGGGMAAAGGTGGNGGKGGNGLVIIATF